MLDELKNQVQAVAEARQLATELKDQRDVLLKEWNEANQVLFDSLTQQESCVAYTEDRLRDLTLQAYAETGMKVPTPGVGIREVTTLEYDPKIAFDWAIEHTIALKLDVIAFVKIAKVSPPDCVRVTTEPQATISHNLDEIFIKEKK